jgi:hypothetical protein
MVKAESLRDSQFYKTVLFRETKGGIETKGEIKKDERTCQETKFLFEEREK